MEGDDSVLHSIHSPQAFPSPHLAHSSKAACHLPQEAPMRTRNPAVALKRRANGELTRSLLKTPSCPGQKPKTDPDLHDFSSLFTLIYMSWQREPSCALGISSSVSCLCPVPGRPVQQAGEGSQHALGSPFIDILEPATISFSQSLIPAHTMPTTFSLLPRTFTLPSTPL